MNTVGKMNENKGCERKPLYVVLVVIHLKKCIWDL